MFAHKVSAKKVNVMWLVSLLIIRLEDAMVRKPW
jgi:hypothetical protein